jgi:hypothetical protein
MARGPDEQLTKYLTDAHSIEVQALAQLRGAPDLAGAPDIAEARGAGWLKVALDPAAVAG